MNKAEIINKLEKTPYDFVCNNYYKLDKSDLKYIAKEAIYLLDKDQQEEFIENLKDWWSSELDEEE